MLGACQVRFAFADDLLVFQRRPRSILSVRFPWQVSRGPHVDAEGFLRQVAGVGLRRGRGRRRQRCGDEVGATTTAKSNAFFAQGMLSA